MKTVSEWQVEDEEGRLPRFITGESYPLGDLHVEIERWFNTIDHLTRDLLTYDHNKRELGEALYHLRTLFDTREYGTPQQYDKQGRLIVLKDEVIARITEAFDVAFRVVNSIPIGDSSASIKLDASSVTIEPNTAFILMWMDKSRPELEDVAGAFKQVFAHFAFMLIALMTLNIRMSSPSSYSTRFDLRNSLSQISQESDPTCTTRWVMLIRLDDVRPCIARPGRLSILTSRSTMFRNTET